MGKYDDTFSLDTFIHLVDETYPSDFFRRAYSEVKSGSACDAPIEEEVARCLVNVILQNYSGTSSPKNNLQRVAGEVDRFAHLVGEVQVRLAEISEAYGDADETMTLNLANKPIHS